MILSDREIRLAMKRGLLQITPEPLADAWSSTAVDLRHCVAMRVDVWTGMFSGVVAMFAIMCTAAVTLGAKEVLVRGS